MEKIRQTINEISLIDQRFIHQAQERLDNLTKPLGSLGRLEELAKQIVGITASYNPRLEKKVIFTFAADHGVTEERISAYPKEVTAQMVYNFLKGGAGINVLARHIGAKVMVADLGVCVDLTPDPALIIRKIDYGTKNMSLGPAMSIAQAKKSITTGIEIFEEEFKNREGIIGTGEMGIGNTTAASAITAVFTRTLVEKVTGKGAGLDNKALENKINIIKKIIEVNKPDPEDPIDVLAKVGGFEIGGLAGVILAAAANKVPVVVDGFISGAAALIAFRLEPKVKEYLIASHCSVESGHKIILGHIGLLPLMDLGLRLGEGTGAALGIGLADAAIKILTEMATFKEANVSNKDSA